MSEHEQWLALGRSFEEAERRSRQRATELADHLFEQDGRAVRENIASTYIEGRTVGWNAYSRDLDLPTDVDDARLQAWADESRAASDEMTQRLLATVEDRGELTRAFIDNYAVNATSNTLWEGIDASGADVAELGSAEWKTWVRSWARKDERDWHSILEGVTIPIEDLFTLPGGPNVGAQVDGPRDWAAVDDPAEHMNCGHALRFLREATAEAIAKTVELGNTVYEPPATGVTPTPSRPVVQARRAVAVTSQPIESFDDAMRDLRRAIGEARAITADVENAIRQAEKDAQKAYNALKAKIARNEPYTAEINAYYDLVEAAKKAKEVALAQAKREQARLIHESLRRSRVGDGLEVSVTTGKASKSGFRNALRGSYAGKEETVAVIDEAFDFFKNVASTENLPNGHSESFFVRAGKAARAFWTEDGVHLSGVKETTGTVVHEIGHGLEIRNRDVQAATMRFRYERTKSEKTVSMNAATGSRGYASWERTRADQFFNPYIGKDYQDFSTEVFTMGVQEMFEDPVRFFDADVEHFELIASILTGRLKDSRFYVDPSVPLSDFLYR